MTLPSFALPDFSGCALVCGRCEGSTDPDLWDDAGGDGKVTGKKPPGCGSGDVVSIAESKFVGNDIAKHYETRYALLVICYHMPRP